MDDKESGLLNQYPNLEGLYEHVKDTLSKESQALSDLSLKATFLWGAITAVLGIVVPIVYQVGKPITSPELLIWILVLYGLNTIMAFWMIFPRAWHDIVDFNTFWSEFSGRPKERFWHDMFVHISDASDKNQRRLLYEAWIIRLICLFTLAQLALVIVWVSPITF